MRQENGHAKSYQIVWSGGGRGGMGCLQIQSKRYHMFLMFRCVFVLN